MSAGYELDREIEGLHRALDAMERSEDKVIRELRTVTAVVYRLAARVAELEKGVAPDQTQLAVGGPL